jgi:hypothetical protein
MKLLYLLLLLNLLFFSSSVHADSICKIKSGFRTYSKLTSVSNEEKDVKIKGVQQKRQEIVVGKTRVFVDSTGVLNKTTPLLSGKFSIKARHTLFKNSFGKAQFGRFVESKKSFEFNLRVPTNAFTKIAHQPSPSSKQKCISENL